MHDACSYLIHQMAESGIVCDCFHIGVLMGTIFGFGVAVFWSVAIDLLGSFKQWLKSKKKPDSQA